MKWLLAILAGIATANLIIIVADYINSWGPAHFMRSWNDHFDIHMLIHIFASLLAIIPAWILGYIFSKWAKNRNWDDRLFAFLGGVFGGCIVGIMFSAYT